ncbi:hypothetical protein [Amycolatopsis lurida]|uniref:hypothetical protein n=1 Tax=Amycolatopsis lurida TaxID=31959 RepID=UPI000AEAA225|nr:hypothetical protein [Amycolatopsis lurida]
MVLLGVVALDGTKIAANAGKDANHTEAHLRKLAEQFVATIAETDTADDARFGADRRGDEPPPGTDRTNRGGRITDALAQIQARRDAAAQAGEGQAEIARAYDAAVSAGVTRSGAPPRGADRVAVARARLDRERATAQARWGRWYEQMRSGGGRRPSGKAAVPPEDHSKVRRARAAYEAALVRAGQVAATAKSQAQAEKFVANLTDPQSRLRKTRNGWVQGYNCQTAVSDDEFLLCARATQDANDLAQFVPTKDDILATTDRLAARTGRDDLTVGVMIGDAGYDSTGNIEAAGPDRLIADGVPGKVGTDVASDVSLEMPQQKPGPAAEIEQALRPGFQYQGPCLLDPVANFVLRQ